MAADKESSALPASALAVAIAVVVGFVAVSELPLEKYRPGSTEKTSEQLIDVQDAEARLWQDPFAAVLRHQEELQKLLGDQNLAGSAWLAAHQKLHSFGSVQDRIHEVLKNNDPLTILGVTVPGGPYAEDTERRQRSRYATLAALNQEHFAPEDGEHVGYVTPRRDKSPVPCADIGLLPDQIPFEWFAYIKGKDETGLRQRKVLVLWLSEHALARKPIASMKALTACLSVNAAMPGLKIRMLAPSSSDTLRYLVEESAREASSSGPQIEFYSASATAGNAALLRGLPPNTQIPICRDPKTTQRGPVCVLRTIATDDALAGLIVDELALRGVRPSECTPGQTCDRVALISEWDTFYGRSLPEAVGRTICPGGQDTCASILRASYLQGIDGAIPGDAAASANAAAPAKRDAKDQTKESARSERADGRHQFDYLRRLADKLRQQNAALDGEGQIKAIGILGSDVYDKLLVLRALRREFPQAEFFTTDLDARLLHPDEFKWARNIVVASSYGFELRRELQRDTPPFRDSYQTSLFYSARLALAAHEKEPDQETIDRQIPPRIFEIGRHSAFPLDPPHSAGQAPRVAGKCGDERLPLSCATVQPELPSLVPRWLYRARWLYLPAFILLALVALPFYPKYVKYKTPLPQRSQPEASAEDRANGIARRVHLEAGIEALNRRRAGAMKVFLLACAALFPLLHVFALLLLASPLNQEPVTFYEGISVWPSEALRFFAGLLALFLLYWALLRMDHSELELSGWFFRDFRTRGIPEYDFERKGLWGSLKRFGTADWKRIFAGDLLRGQDFHKSAGRLDTEMFWRECAFHSSLPASVVRTTVAALSFYAFGLLLELILDRPHTPYRGDLSYWADLFVVVFWSTPLLTFLTFYVADATLLCKRFIRTLSERHTDWPSFTREHFGAGLPESLHSPAAAGNQPQPGDLDEAYDNWIDLSLIGERTATVSSLVYYPFLVMLLLLFARSTLFDNWHWPVGLVVPLAIIIVILITCMVVLRREAERARGLAVAKVSRRLLIAKGRSDDSAKIAAQLELMLKAIQDTREGAFASIPQQPLVKALLIFLSASGLALLEYFGVISF